MWVLVLFLILLGLFLLYVIITHLLTKSRIKKAFICGNVIVTGRKRFGKDILFQAVIKWRNEPYFANIDYGGKYQHIEAKELELSPNTFNNFINGNVVQCAKNEMLEKHDVYFSDGGVIFPSQADSTLHKIYPSFPISYALTGHLWANGIHVNAQRIERIWKALREQADYYILIRKRRLKIGCFFVIFTTEYTKYESAKRELSPLGSRLFNKYSKAEKDKFKAENGFIKNGFVIVPSWYLKYDTRAYHKVIYGVDAPKENKKSIFNIFKKKENKK